MNNPYFGFLRYEVQAAPGLLSLFGLNEISTDEVEEFWEPESQEEKDSLKLFSFSRKSEPTSSKTWPSISFDIAARPLLIAELSGDFDAALNFFRKGRIDIKGHNYIDAVLDFLFMVETTYANGKFKTAQVEAEYLSSEELKQLIAQALKERSLLVNIRGTVESSRPSMISTVASRLKM